MLCDHHILYTKITKLTTEPFVFKIRHLYAVLAPSLGVVDSQNTRGIQALPNHVSH